ncbi:MAG TPA: diaminopimelate epimerase [Candidatus Angelobacter sp.]
MTAVPFTKASACGNDFLIIDAARMPADPGDFTRRICDRHNGVGADGVEWVSPGENADLSIRLINADGSEAEISGNGTRCVAAYAVAGGSKEKLAIRTGAGIKRCELVSRSGNSFEFEMEMGTPQVSEPFMLKLASGSVKGTPVSMGNPHYVVFVEEFPAAWQEEAAQTQKQPCFREGVNVEFVRAIGRHEIDIRIFERGAGETQSSGTGSCASAVAAIAAGRAQSPVSVHATGGTQVVGWSGPGTAVTLRGPAQLICRGEFFG